MPCFTLEYGNPASPHVFGKMASSHVERARESVADVVGARSGSLVFTSGATEANNLAILGTARPGSPRRKIVVSSVEHKSVLLAAGSLEVAGFTVVTLPVDSNGVVVLEAAEGLIDQNTLLVSVQAVNNETGVIQPVQAISDVAHAVGALYHCDAVQALGKLPLNLDESGCDLAVLSAHKAYGPKGVGALYVGHGVRRRLVLPLMWGGGQERGLRPGTLNVPGIVGFGAACRLVKASLDADGERMSRLRSLCEKELLTGIPGSWVNSEYGPRVPGTISLTVPGVPADMLIANLPAVCIGEGSACHSGAPEPSHVLLAMGLERLDADATVRISLGRYTTESEVRIASERIIGAAKELVSKLARGGAGELRGASDG